MADFIHIRCENFNGSINLDLVTHTKNLSAPDKNNLVVYFSSGESIALNGEKSNASLSELIRSTNNTIG